MRKLFYSIILTMIGTIIFIPKVYAIPDYENISYRLIENYDNNYAKLEIKIPDEDFSNYTLDLEEWYYNYTDEELMIFFPKALTIIMAWTDDYEYNRDSIALFSSTDYVKYMVITNSAVLQLYDSNDNLLFDYPLSFDLYLYTVIEDGLTFQDGYNAGFLEGRKQYGYYENGLWYSAEDYAVNEFDNGYYQGIDEAGGFKMAIKDFVPGILGSIFMFFFTLSSMSILGISILEVLVLIFGVGAIIFVIKLIF